MAHVGFATCWHSAFSNFHSTFIRAMGNGFSCPIKFFHLKIAIGLALGESWLLLVQPQKNTDVRGGVASNADIIHDMQCGAISVEDPQGAEMLRRLDMLKFKEVLKRKFLEGPGSNQSSLEALNRSVVSIEQAKECLPFPISVGRLSLANLQNSLRRNKDVNSWIKFRL